MEMHCLGPSPVAESCAQIGTEGYEIRAHHECTVYANQLRRHFEQHHRHPLPASCSLVVREMPHDYGTYMEVALKYDPNSSSAIGVLVWLDDNLPETWDSEALVQLSS